MHNNPKMKMAQGMKKQPINKNTINTKLSMPVNWHNLSFF